MPVKKKANRKNLTKIKQEKPVIPTKKQAVRRKHPLEIHTTSRTADKRVTALATVGKKKKPS